MGNKERERILEASGLSFSYGRKKAVDDLWLRVYTGELVGLLGPNGAGKTTCMRLLVGLLRSSAGSILFGGKDISKLTIDRRARLGLGYLPQEPSIFRRMTVRQNLQLVLEERGLPRPEQEERIGRLLERFDLSALSSKMPDGLSGGERRRVEIARALALEPKLLLFDEPFAGIDPIGVGKLQKLLKSLGEEGVGVLITDHNIRETLKICHRATIIDAGRCLCEGPPASLAANKKARSRYLGEDFRLDM